MSRISGQPDPSDLPPDEIPSKLAHDLFSLYRGPRVPWQVDAAILNAARAHLAGSVRREGLSRHRRLLRWAGAGAAVAAAVAAVVIVVIRPQLTTNSQTSIARSKAVASDPSRSGPTVAGDVDGNGRVDILDAFVVARALADASRSGPLPSAWDVNGDGVVDQRDVDWLANAAVRVGGTAGNTPGSPTDVFRLADNLRSLDGSPSGSGREMRLARLGARPGAEDRGLSARGLDGAASATSTKGAVAQ